MKYGTEIKEDVCARCRKKITVPAVYRGHEWYHARCWQEREKLLANASRLATSINGEIIPPVS